MKQRVLVVEDNERLRHAVARELEAAGYDVAQAQDYRDALDILEDGSRFAALVVDVVLPVVNGFALARMARLRYPKIKVVYLTGVDHLPMAEANGPILHKPVSPETLLAAVREVLRPS